MMQSTIVEITALTLLMGCGSTVIQPAPLSEDVAHAPVPKANPLVKMRHQILFSGTEREDVFEGFMVLFDTAFYVKAFAGPGVALFTIARKGDERLDRLHIPGLSDRIDIRRVGDDINRVYLVGCSGVPASRSRECKIAGERVIERYDDQGDLLSKVFPDAHGIGLTVSYEAYGNFDGLRLSKRISLRWGESENRMVILLVSATRADGKEREVLDEILPSPKHPVY